jgi:hypothetical protein
MADAIPRSVLASVLQDSAKPIGQRMRTIFFLKGMGERQDAEVLEKGEMTATTVSLAVRNHTLPSLWVACCACCHRIALKRLR